MNIKIGNDIITDDINTVLNYYHTGATPDCKSLLYHILTGVIDNVTQTNKEFMNGVDDYFKENIIKSCNYDYSIIEDFVGLLDNFEIIEHKESLTLINIINNKLGELKNGKYGAMVRKKL